MEIGTKPIPISVLTAVTNSALNAASVFPSRRIEIRTLADKPISKRGRRWRKHFLAGDDGDGHGALQVSAGGAASAVLPCPQALPRPIARFAERRSGCGPQFRHRTPEGAQGLTTENCTRAAIEGYGSSP
jgi:hypothetical protein